MSDLKLSKQMSVLYNRLEGRGDVPINELCMALGLDPGSTTRTTQQVVGPYIVRLNHKLREHGLLVVPGQLKRTYTLVPAPAA